MTLLVVMETFICALLSDTKSHIANHEAKFGSSLSMQITVRYDLLFRSLHN